MQFTNRTDAGQALARKLHAYRGKRDVIVLALPRGGVPVAYEVAKALDPPLDLFIVRKLGFPGHEEYAMGAIASGGIRVMNPEASNLGIPQSAIDAVTRREEEELARRERLYRGDRPPLEIRGRTVILVDDGLARDRRCARPRLRSNSRTPDASSSPCPLQRRKRAKLQT